jgi:hypothetical protein
LLGHSKSAVFKDETATVVFQKFDLESRIASFFATYRDTDRSRNAMTSCPHGSVRTS